MDIKYDRLVESFQSLSNEAFVMKAYLSLLGRAPDPNGQAGYLSRLRGGIPRAQVWAEIAAAEEALQFKNRHSAAPDLPQRAALRSVDDLLKFEGIEFIIQAYREVLGREVDPTGSRDCASRMASGTSKRQLLADLRCDPEGQKYAAPLTGLDEIVRQVQARGLSAAPVTSLNDLLALHGHSFVRVAYLTLFKREPDTEGLERYVDLLRAGFSTLYVLKALYEAPEAREKKARLPGLKVALADYEKAQLRSWRGWYYRHVKGMPSELPRDRELRALAYQ